MLTTIDKALVNVVMGLASLAVYFGVIIPPWFSEATVISAVAFLAPILTWWIPNKSS